MMAAIGKRDTVPERLVRGCLHAAGLRYRLHRKDLPGTPDLVLPGRRLVVRVHGCFWHAHPGCKLARTPRRNLGYWLPKLARNVERDAADHAALTALGWSVVTVWECEARDPQALGAIVRAIAAAPCHPRRRLSRRA
jgi:DNA mismatch endonuclease (patch repair protein)